eukprot:357031-Chlamydomonas_euryale.AAC.8
MERFSASSQKSNGPILPQLTFQLACQFATRARHSMECLWPMLELAQHPHMPERGKMRHPNPGEAFIGSNSQRQQKATE